MGHLDCKHCQQWCQMETICAEMHWNGSAEWFIIISWKPSISVTRPLPKADMLARFNVQCKSVDVYNCKFWPYIKGAEIYILWFLYIKENAPSPYFGPVLCGKTADKKTRCYKFTPNTYKYASLKTVLTSETWCIWSNIKYVFKLSVYSHLHSGFR